MAQVQTAQLTPEERQRLSKDYLANEQAYWNLRDSVLPQYRGRWVAVSGGKLVAAGAELLEVMEKASALGGDPFFALVGGEDAVVFRVRRAAYAYDQAYQPFPLGGERVIEYAVILAQRS
jgi:hypothetical protein